MESNESLRQELDDIVGGLQGYLSNVKQKGLKSQRDFESLLGEKASLQEKVRALERELSVLDGEAGKVQEMEMVRTVGWGRGAGEGGPGEAT